MRTFGAAPVFSLGFRLFFLAGAAFAALAVAIWALWLYGRWPGVEPVGGMLAWHRHEMPFGFAVAIIAGFLADSGAELDRSAGTQWLAADRAGAGLAAGPAGVADADSSCVVAGASTAFLPLLAWVLGRDLLAAGKTKSPDFVDDHLVGRVPGG
jgi:uncharacterized protein involved in response to NO